MIKALRIEEEPNEVSRNRDRSENKSGKMGTRSIRWQRDQRVDDE